MERTKIEEKICQIIEEQLGVEGIDVHKDLQKEYDVDSIGVLDFIMSVEDAFEIQFAETDLESMKTVEQVIDRVEALLS
ncbi:MAG: phosphopantetheine-binding protein [Ndongobacter sp.]|nr:phosphopantetheine-binding protein [Ndongobacter sp.]